MAPPMDSPKKKDKDRKAANSKAQSYATMEMLVVLNEKRPNPRLVHAEHTRSEINSCYEYSARSEIRPVSLSEF